MSNKIAIFIALACFSFILWIIYLADTGSSSIFFKLARRVPYGDKFGHIFLFGILTITFNFASKFKSYSLGKFNLYFGTTAVTIFVILEELSQGLFPTRVLDLADLTADFIGIIIFTYFSHLANTHITKISSKDAASGTT